LPIQVDRQAAKRDGSPIRTPKTTGGVHRREPRLTFMSKSHSFERQICPKDRPQRPKLSPRSIGTKAAKSIFMDIASKRLTMILGVGLCGFACSQGELSSKRSSESRLPPITVDPVPSPPSNPADNGQPSNTTIVGEELTAGMWDDNVNFEHFRSYVQNTQTITGVPFLTLAEQEAARERFQQRERNNKIDVVLVLDTTGSMYDELDYLKDEFMDLLTSVSSEFCRQGVDIRLGLVAYADEGESYVVLNHGFPGNENFDELLKELPRTHGGDYPEAAAKGLSAATSLPWQEGDNTARIIFWMADAPHHASENGRMEAAVREAMNKDIHIYPIGASGLDERTEKLMRMSAQITGGRYIFLTDDSGIGNAHKEPRIPCYFVTTLQDAMTRAVISELRGGHSLPRMHQIIRTGGDPQDGSCTLENGTQVVAF
jgi:hypothetical protein